MLLLSGSVLSTVLPVGPDCRQQQPQVISNNHSFWWHLLGCIIRLDSRVWVDMLVIWWLPALTWANGCEAAVRVHQPLPTCSGALLMHATNHISMEQ
jgi:hypothetical protein